MFSVVCVCYSVCLFMGVGPHHTGPQPPSVQGFGPAPVQGLALAPWTCSNLFKLDLSLQERPPFHPPRHVQTCSLCSLDCGQAGSWNSTEIPFCQT